MKLSLFLLLLGIAESVFAFRCGSQLVDVGDTRYEVEANCGVPDDVTRTTYYRSIANNAVVDCDRVRTHSVDSLGMTSGSATDRGARSCLLLVEDQLAVRVDAEIWLYDFGKNRFMQQVHMEQGRVVHIEQLGYGVKPRR